MAASWFPYLCAGRLRVCRAHFGRRIASACSRASSTSTARSIDVLANVLLLPQNVLIGSKEGACSRLPPPHCVRVQRACAVCALSAVCVFFVAGLLA